MARIRTLALHLAVPIFVLIVWEVVSELRIFPVYIIPPLSMVLSAGLDLILSGEAFVHIYSSLYRILGGLALAVVIGVPMGVGIGWSRRLSMLLEPILNLLRQIPPLAWIPFALIWFKGGFGSAAFVVLIAAFFPVLLSTISGVQNVSRGLVEVASTLGCDRRQLLIKVVVPAASPTILTGIRIGLGIGWMAIVAAEYFGFNYGMGALIILSYNILRTDRMVVGMFLIGLIGFLMDRAFRVFERRAVRWQGR